MSMDRAEADATTAGTALISGSPTENEKEEEQLEQMSSLIVNQETGNLSPSTGEDDDGDMLSSAIDTVNAPSRDDEENEEEVKVNQSLLALVEEQQPNNSNPPLISDNLNNNEHDQETVEKVSCMAFFFKRFCSFYTNNDFLIHIILAILLAFAYPELGHLYFYPQITATWIAVILIFLLSGISLKSEEFKNALKRLGFNLFVQIYNFGFVSVFMFGISNLIVYLGIIARSLADGMIISSCVPITVNMILVLTKSSNGDEAAAVFNAAFGSLLGIFISPLLILLYLGQKVSIDIGNVFYKLCLRVLLPIVVGQLIHRYSVRIVSFIKERKKFFKKVQEGCLVFIVYTVFCTTFYEQRSRQGQTSEDGEKLHATTVTDAVIMIAFQFIILSTLMGIAWMLLKLLYRNQPALRVMGLFGCTHKSVAIGIPLINAIYDGDPNIGFYTLPLLVWHPMQLVIGSFLAPRLAKFVDREEERIRSEQNP